MKLTEQELLKKYKPPTLSEWILMKTKQHEKMAKLSFLKKIRLIEAMENDKGFDTLFRRTGENEYKN